ncbi:MAG: 2-iminoacetate synthase ThiH [Ruminococcus sp.]|nr:2-iminoacetate synthase ThiH [Ruminococcus sp.]
MARKVFNHMEYQEGMDVIESDIMDNILNLTSKYDYNTYTKDDVLKALSKDILTLEDFGALLSPVATNMLELMAQRSKKETAKHFGNTVTMFTPLYIANYCENECVYCGLNCKNRIKRGMLSLEQIDIEMKNIADTGLRDILLLTGECRHMSDVEYIGEAVKIAKKYFTSISIEVYPLNIDEYKYLQECGADFVCVYQETYDPIRYEQVHLSGFKRCYPYRVNAHERALLGGMRGVSFGALLGLSDFRKDAFSAGVHAMLIQKKYPHAEISFSFPRLRPYKNNAENNSNDVHEKQLLQIMLAYRIFMPYAGITISTRERDGFRDNVIGLCATKISAGVKVSVGGHGEEAQGDEQFEISDPRSVDEVYNSVLNHGLQPVFTDYIRTN